MTAPAVRPLRGDALLAAVLALLLAAAWTWRDWTDLAALRLPDTDDVMRLQQVRDWLAGQRFADLAQHRLGPGLPMHWSRLADLLPAGIIALLNPALGRHAAEIAAVIAAPALLFAAALLLVARIARALRDDLARTAAIVAALAFPATGLFMPGRIDHHGLQLVLLLVVILALVSPASVGRGTVAGVAAAASIAIGLETVPLLAVAGALAVAAWIVGQSGAERRLAGLGLGATLALLAAAATLRPDAWAYPACDGFTREAWRAAQLAALGPMLLVMLGRHAAAANARLAFAAAIGAGIGALVATTSPGCLSPYGQVDPVLAELWLSRVAEAQPLARAPFAVAVGHAGILLAGVGAGAWQVVATRRFGWIALLSVQLAALALALLQLRGVYAGALLAAPALAATVSAARAHGATRLAGAWLVSTGMLYPLAAHALPRPEPRDGVAGGGAACASPDALAALARLPAARTLAPLDLGAYVLATTNSQVIAAPYHRNNPANRASYDFYLGDERRALAVVRRWRVARILVCPGALADVARVPWTMARRLEGGSLPGWIRPVSRLPGGMRVLAVEPGLPPIVSPH